MASDITSKPVPNAIIYLDPESSLNLQNQIRQKLADLQPKLVEGSRNGISQASDGYRFRGTFGLSK